MAVKQVPIGGQEGANKTQITALELEIELLSQL